ncbi:3-carboxy-cis,cis-muconate cycloisomerase OS=Streptomyces fumanus OX=67302 GN=GCM10018772_34190 PE=3 SV=1 [Streptomyces fumanus]
MTSDATDTSLLAPGWTGSPAAEATGNRAYLRALLDAEAALTRAQATLGLAPEAAATAVTEAADPDRFDPVSLAERARGGGNPVIPLVADLTKAVGEEYGPYVHRGATSRDIMDTATMLVAVRALAPVLADLARTERALAALAAAHRETAMPGRTLTQHAVPTTFGLKAAGWRSLVLDARDRVAAVRCGPARPVGRRSPAPSPRSARTAPGTRPRLLGAYARELGLAEPLLPLHAAHTVPRRGPDGRC